MKAARVVPALLLALVACGGAAPVRPAPPVTTAEPPAREGAPSARATPDAPFRANAPAPDGDVTFVAPRVEEAKLANGVRVLLVERHDLPVVSLRVVVSAGAGDIPGARPGETSFLGAMLEQGTTKRSALAIDDDYDAIGAAHGSWFGWDSGGASVKVLSDKLDPALEILSDVVLHPTFPDAEVARLRARRIAALESDKSSPGAILQNAIAASLFGRAHPYGHSLSGEIADAKKLTRAELVSLYKRTFAPENTAIVVAGDVTKDALVAKLEATFGAWKGAPGAVKRTPPKPPAHAAANKTIVLVDKPGAQSQVMLVRPGVPFATKDRDAIVVMNAILGGMFSSRVNMNLREKHAYTYGAHSYFAMRHGAGPFAVGASVFADKTAASIKEIYGELEKLREGGPSDEELALAKENILRAMPGRFETTSEVATALEDLVVYDLPLDHYATRPARVEAVTSADVKRLAGELLDGKDMKVVVVGDKAKLAPELDALGKGPFEELDAYGNPVAVKVDGGPKAPAKKAAGKPSAAKPAAKKPAPKKP